MTIRIENVTKRFDDFTAVDRISLEVASGELVALLGPSGSGKTTLLRMIAGLDFPDEGRILFDGHDATERHARHRRVGFVFQHYALFRHMTVADNIDFGLRVMPRKTRPSVEERRRRVARLLELVQLAPLAGRYPSQLSGGQRQRVALARALAIEPRVLLLDEPFGALDATVRKELRRWLRRLHDEIHVTSLFVTHDQEEALEVSDRVVVMNHGRIEQVGSPTAVHDEPESPFVYQFLGHSNRFEACIENGRVAIGSWSVPVGEAGLDQATVDGATTGIAFVRPHDMELHPADTTDTISGLTIRHAVARGGQMRVELAGERPEVVYEAELPRSTFDSSGLAVGDPVAVRPRAVQVFAGPAG